MASSDAKSLQGDDPPDSPPNNPSENEPAMTMPSTGYSMHMYPFPSHLLPQQPARSKRRQVKNACTNCQKACKKCDDARPCLRCVKYGISEECIDSQRKERKKGIKRGPYKKRDGKDRAGSSSVEQPEVSTSPDAPASNSGPPLGGGSPPPPPPLMSPYMLPGYFPQYAPGPLLKPADNGHMYPQYLAPLPQPVPLAVPHGGPEMDHNGYPAQQFYPAFVPFGAPAVYPYMMPRHEGQVPGNYVLLPMYAAKVGGPSEMGGGEQRQSDEGSDEAGGAG